MKKVILKLILILPFAWVNGSMQTEWDNLPQTGHHCWLADTGLPGWLTPVRDTPIRDTPWDNSPWGTCCRIIHHMRMLEVRGAFSSSSSLFLPPFLIQLVIYHSTPWTLWRKLLCTKKCVTLSQVIFFSGRGLVEVHLSLPALTSPVSPPVLAIEEKEEVPLVYVIPIISYWCN